MNDSNSKSNQDTTSEEKQGSKLASRWNRRICKSKKYFKSYYDQCERVKEAYLVEDPLAIDASSKASRYPILKNTIDSLRPAFFGGSKLVPQIDRRFGESGDAEREAAELLEKATTYSMDESNFEVLRRKIIDDGLLYSRNVTRVVYNAEVLEREDEDGETYDEIQEESCKLRFVGRHDFVHDVKELWEDVTWVAFRALMTYEEVEERFGEDIAKNVQYCDPEDDKKRDTTESNPDDVAFIWEIWDKKTRTQLFISEHDADLIIEENKDPYGLRQFFPCPRPLYFSLEPDTLRPIPEYIFWEDLATQFNRCNRRIAELIPEIEYKVAFPHNMPELASIVSSGGKRAIAVKQWKALMEKGGLKGVLATKPIADLVNTLMTLLDTRERLKGEIFEVSGVMDLMRGSNDPRATATAERIKGNWGGAKVEEKQTLVEEYLRDLLQLKAELIAERYTDESLALISGLDLMQDEAAYEAFMNAVQLLRIDVLRRYKLSIETNATRAFDEQAEKEAAVEYLNSVTGFVQNTAPVLAQMPEFIPYLKEVMLWTSRRYRAGRSLESSLESSLAALEEAIVAQQQQPPPEEQPQEDPTLMLEMQKIQVDAQDKQTRTQIEIERLRAEQAKEQMKLQLEEQKTVVEDLAKRDERELKAVQLQLEARKVAIEESKLALQAQEQQERQRKEKAETVLKMQAQELQAVNEATARANEVAQIGQSQMGMEG